MKYPYFIVFLLLAGCLANPAAANQDGASASKAARPPTEQPTATQKKPTAAPMLATTVLPDLGPAPELNNQVWLNTDKPLRLADLRGKVVLLDMWTFG
jgi:hypothetical protein